MDTSEVQFLTTCGYIWRRCRRYRRYRRYRCSIWGYEATSGLYRRLATTLCSDVVSPPRMALGTLTQTTPRSTTRSSGDSIFDPSDWQCRTELLPTDPGIIAPQEFGALQVRQSTSGWQQLIDCATLQLKSTTTDMESRTVTSIFGYAFDLRSWLQATFKHLARC